MDLPSKRHSFVLAARCSLLAACCSLLAGRCSLLAAVCFVCCLLLILFLFVFNIFRFVRRMFPFVFLCLFLVVVVFCCFSSGSYFYLFVLFPSRCSLLATRCPLLALENKIKKKKIMFANTTNSGTAVQHEGIGVTNIMGAFYQQRQQRW